MEFPEGKYSIRVSMEDIAQSPDALVIVAKAVKPAAHMDIAPGADMWSMMKSTTPEAIIAMTGSLLPDGFAESLSPAHQD